MRPPASLSHPVRVPRIFDRLLGLPPEHAWIVVLLCLDLAALADLATGRVLWLGPVYLLVICLAAWTLGWRAGQAIGLGCMALTFALNGITLYPYGAAEFGWNLAARFVAISTVIVVIAGARRAYVREWWLARTDVLTGALNRQAFFELGEALSAGTCWRVLLYADLDGLKALNDGCGHAAGDASLTAYAHAVRRNIRRTDLFARVGGDEFLVFVAVKDEPSARAVGARLHREMNRAETAPGEGLRCSVGGLLVPPGAFAIDDLVRQADELMYQAKLRGACLELAVASATGPVARPGGARARPRPAEPASRLVDKPFGERRGPAASAARAAG
jgi:diguanylate cyclase (GGDEF)-like protein